MPGLTRRAARKTAHTVRRFARTKRNLVGVRRQIFPTSGRRGGGECECEEIHRFWTNGPDGGTFTATYVINAVSGAVTWDWDASGSKVQAAFEAHAQVNSGDVLVSGGPWPHVAIYVKFAGNLADKNIAFPALNNTSLTNGAGFMDKFTTVEED